MSRDVLSPPLMWMGRDRCYRINVIHPDFVGPRYVPTQATGYQEEDLYTEEDDDADLAKYPIEDLGDSVYKLSMQIPSAFYGGIVGMKGTTKRRIEKETKTEITVPPANSKSDVVSIKARSQSDARAACRQINLLTQSLRSKLKATHFVSVPVNDDSITKSFAEFKNLILAKNYPGIDESLFQVGSCVHITLGACVLLNDSERHQGVKFLQSCSTFLKDLNPPFKVNIRGLEIMNDDPSAVRVLYARIDAPELQIFADRVSKALQATEFCCEKRESVKLHMTVMNMRYLKATAKGPHNNFDARALLKDFGNINFGTAKCNELKLCVCGSKQIEGKEKQYTVTSSLELS